MTRHRGVLAWWGTAVLFVAMGAWLRWYQLDLQIALDDEWHALHKLQSTDARGILLSFGYADHSIPLTLAYRWLALHGGLTEWAMRMPQLIASIALLPALGWLFRREGSIPGLAVAIGLLAVSPLAIHFAKLARPYALTMLLAPIAVVACFRAWHASSRVLRTAWGATYVACAFLSAWLHTVTLAFVLAPLAWFGIAALSHMRPHGGLPGALRPRWLPWLRLLAVGLPLAALLLATLGPPMSHDWNAIAAKSGKDAVSLEALGRSAMLLAGTRHPAVAVLSVALVGIGVIALDRRSPALRRLVRYLLACCALLAAAVIGSGAMYIHHPLVLARYLLPTLPLLCWFAGEGVIAIAAAGRRAAGALTSRSRDETPVPNSAAAALRWHSTRGAQLRAMGGAVVSIAGITALALQGPLPAILVWPNQFIGHLRYQFDYDPVANPYERLAVGITIPDVYRELAKRPPMSTTIVEMPWRLESHYNPLPWYQQVHRQRVMIGMVGGVCGARAWGEYPPDGRIRFRNFVHLSEILAGKPVAAEFLLIHRRSWAIDHDPTIEWPDMQACLPKVVAKLGRPLADDGDMVLFGLSPGMPAAGISPDGGTGGAAEDRLRNARGG